MNWHKLIISLGKKLHKKGIKKLSSKMWRTLYNRGLHPTDIEALNDFLIDLNKTKGKK